MLGCYLFVLLHIVNKLHSECSIPDTASLLFKSFTISRDMLWGSVAG